MLSKIKELVNKFYKKWTPPNFTKNFIDSYEDEITIEQLDKFLSIHGEKGAKTLSLAGKVRAFNTAIGTDIGREILHDTMIKMEVLLEKIINEKASKEELAEYRVLRNIINRWSNKIMLFEEAKKKIKEA